MRELAERLLKRTRKSWLRTRPFVESNSSVDESEIVRIEHRIGARLPADLREWLLVLGFGNFGDVLSIQANWFFSIEHKSVKGAVIFGQDDFGNFYACLPQDGCVVYFCRSDPECAVLAPSFRSFMEELERRDFKLGEWVDGVVKSPCIWSA